MSNGPDDPPPVPGGEGIASLILQLDAMLEPILEATNGLRSKLVEQGFTSEAASQMTAEYYRTLMALVRVKAFGANG